LVPSGSALDYSTFVGGERSDRLFSLVLRESGSVVVFGKTWGWTFNKDVVDHTFGHLGSDDALVMGFTIDDMSPTGAYLDGGDLLYAGLRTYDMAVDANPSKSNPPPHTVHVSVDPGGANVILGWTSGEVAEPFFEVQDEHDHLELMQGSCYAERDDTNGTLMLHFGFVPGWNWPHEDPCDLVVEARRAVINTTNYLVKDLFSVENDLDFYGDVLAEGEWQGDVEEGDWVRGEEGLTFYSPLVVYEGTTDVHPPDSTGKVRIDGPIGAVNSSPYTSGERSVLKMMTPRQTIKEAVYTISLVNLPGTAESRGTRDFTLAIDANEPTFERPEPSGDDWQGTSRVLLSIAVNDTGTSGVNASTLEYSYSTSGLSPYSEWSRGGLRTTPSGPIVVGEVEIDLPDGESYVRWRVKDLVGISASSDQLLIRVDTRNVSFHSPIPEGWQTISELDCGVTIQDLEGSGIDVGSIQYRVSYLNVSGYDEWVDWEGDLEDSMEVSVTFRWMFSKTPYNMVQWRAMDIAGNGHTRSPHYRVLVDVDELTFSGFEPSPDVFQGNSDVECFVTCDDGAHGSGVDLSSIEYRVRQGDNEYSEWTGAGMQGTAGPTRFSIVVPFDEGAENRIQLRGWDVAGNGPTESPEHLVKVDLTPPEITVLSTIGGTRVTEGTVEFTYKVQDMLSGIDDATIMYRYALDGLALEDDWHPLTPKDDGALKRGSVEIEFAIGRNNRVQFKAGDIVGNEGLSDVITVWVNSPPTAQISRVGGPAGSTVVVLSGAGSSDPDDDDLSFTWMLDIASVTLDDGKELHVDTGEYPAGVITIVLVVEDGMGGMDEASYDLTIEEAETPEPSRDPSYGLWIILVVIATAFVVAYAINRWKGKS